MAKNKEIKTNAMRILDRMKIPYRLYTYACDTFVDGMQSVRLLGLDEEKVYKTLVTENGSQAYFVFVIPVGKELDLKKAARQTQQKSLSMIPVKQITPVTGYVRGGCTALGMKKQYPTILDASAERLPAMVVSAGRIGAQIELAPADLCRAAGARFAPVTVED